MCRHTWVTTDTGRRCTSCGEARDERPHTHVFGPVMARVCLDCGFVVDRDFQPVVTEAGERPFIISHREAQKLQITPIRPSNYGDRKPIVIRSTRPRTNDEMREMWEITSALGWPLLVLDHDWEIVDG